MRSTRGSTGRGWLGYRLVCVAVAGLLVTASAHAAEPKGFVDGEWKGRIRWDASLEVGDVSGSGTSNGEFAVGFSGGIPLGSFMYVVDNGSGVTPEARADLTLNSSGAFGGSATEPALVSESASVTGEVEVFGVDTFPVDFTMGAGELAPLPLDIITADCSTVTGLLTTQTAQLGDIAGGLGGSASVGQAYWSAIRIGNTGATDDEQLATLDQLIDDALEVLAPIDDGSYDAVALSDVLGRAEALAAGINRNASCGIGDPGVFTSSVATLVQIILEKMVAKEELFDASEFWSAILAGVRSGAVGSSAGPDGEALTLELRNVLRTKFSNAVAGSNAADLHTIHLAALLLDDEMLAGDALDEAAKL